MSLFSVLSVSASGMAAQRVRAELATENLANSETTRTAAGGPYRRKQAVFMSEGQTSPFGSVYQQALGTGVQGVRVSEVIEDPRGTDSRYQPGHPDANSEGYVDFPKIDPAEEMVDLMGASRGYQANVNAMVAIRDMIHRSIDLLR
jgi:flagellar basal-body rod protein FlgC